MAIAALVMTFICFPIGLILGLVALLQINRSDGELGGNGVALAAVILSGLSVPMMGIVAGIAVPNFVRYSLRSKAAEVRMLMPSIVSAQMVAKEKYGRYLAAAPSASTVGSQKQFWGPQPCDPGCAYDNPSACTSFDCLELTMPEEVYFSYACEVSSDGANFTCAALGDLDGNGTPSLFVYGTGSGQIVAPTPSFGGQSPPCPQALADQVFECTAVPREF